jgi:hypothetical protein
MYTGEGLQALELCEKCLNALLSSGREDISDFLDALDKPAALGRDQTVLFSNIRMSRMLSKFDHDIAGLSIGEALECRFAASERRCGESAICMHCGLRRLVELARISGEKIAEFPMIIPHRSGESQTYTFTTEKAGEAVLLTIGAQS